MKDARASNPPEPEWASAWVGTHHRVLTYLLINAMEVVYFFVYGFLNPLKVRHRERLPALQPGDLYAIGPHEAQVTDGILPGLLWFPFSLLPSAPDKLPWVLATMKHLGDDWRDVARLAHVIPVVQSGVEGDGNSRETLRHIKWTLAHGSVIYYPGGTRAAHQTVPRGDAAAGALARAAEVQRITPIGLYNPAQPYRHHVSDPSLTLPRWVDNLLIRATSSRWRRVSKLAKVLRALDWLIGVRIGQRPVITIGEPMTPETLRSRVKALRANRAVTGIQASLNQCYADILMEDIQRLREEP